MIYRKGDENKNADSSSRLTCYTKMDEIISHRHIKNAQNEEMNMVIKMIKEKKVSTNEKSTILRRYKQILHQLVIHEGLIFRKYYPSLDKPPKLYILVPVKLRPSFMESSHNSISSGQLSYEKNFASSLKYLLLARDIQEYSRAMRKLKFVF